MTLFLSLTFHSGKLPCELIGLAQGNGTDVLHLEKSSTLVSVLASISGCTMRVVGYDFYGGDCAMSLVMWESGSGATFREYFESSRTTTQGSQMHRIFFSNPTDTAIIMADQSRYFGLENDNPGCVIAGQPSPSIGTYYEPIAAPGIGKTTKFQISHSIDLYFRVYLEGMLFLPSG